MAKNPKYAFLFVIFIMFTFLADASASKYFTIQVFPHASHKIKLRTLFMSPSIIITPSHLKIFVIVASFSWIRNFYIFQVE